LAKGVFFFKDFDDHASRREVSRRANHRVYITANRAQTELVARQI